MHHFKEVAERLKDEAERGAWDRLIIGCPGEQWSEFEQHLHPYVKQRIMGRFSGDVAGTNSGHIQEEAARVLQESLSTRKQNLVHEVLDQAKANSLGVTGLRRVLRSLEMGEIQTLLIGDGYRAQGVECPNCRHLDSRMVKACPVCGHETRELEDICEAIIPQAIAHDVELFYIRDNAEFDHAGNIAALLRFRADQNTNDQIAAAS
jgi:peptide chain release factor subunit 1